MRDRPRRKQQKHRNRPRPILGAISAPTLVLHRLEEPVPVEGARYMASRITGAKLVELDGDDQARQRAVRTCR